MAASVAPTLQSREGLKFVLVPPSGMRIVESPHGGATQGRPLTADQAAALAPDAAVLLDGNMFEYCAGEPHDYGRYQCGMTQYRYLDRSRGVDAASAYPSRGMTLSVADGAVHAASGASVYPGADFAVQLYPELLRGGNVVATDTGTNSQRVWRAGVGIMPDGSVVYAVGQDTMVGFANALKRLGAVEAGYTDGGGSTRLRTRDGHAGSGENRRVPAWLAWFPPGTLGAAEDVIAVANPANWSSGTQLGAIALGTLGAVALAVAVMRAART